jgi:hypothetical protein
VRKTVSSFSGRYTRSVLRATIDGLQDFATRRVNPDHDLNPDLDDIYISSYKGYDCLVSQVVESYAALLDAYKGSPDAHSTGEHPYPECLWKLPDSLDRASPDAVQAVNELRLNLSRYLYRFNVFMRAFEKDRDIHLRMQSKTLTTAARTQLREQLVIDCSMEMFRRMWSVHLVIFDELQSSLYKVCVWLDEPSAAYVVFSANFDAF